jgi:SAM-dependent methyltransferase
VVPVRRVLASIAFLVLLTSSTAALPQPPASDDAIWKDFVGWLDEMPPVAQVVSVLDLYRKELAGKGLRQQDVKLTMDRLLGLMRDRPDAWRPIFNRIYKASGTTFNTDPTPLLVQAVKARNPGTALDVGMGQGRNAVFLALKGWDVTGIDLAEEGLAVAKAQATRAGTSLNAVAADAARFDYGREAWDLIVITYGPGFVGDAPFAERLKSALRPGGLLVMESFASNRSAATRRPVDLDPAELLQRFQSYRIIRFEDVDDVSEWDPQVTRLVRLIAEKPPA